MTETGYRRPSGVSVRLLVGVVLAGTLSVLDSTIVVPLLSSIGEDLDLLRVLRHSRKVDLMAVEGHASGECLPALPALRIAILMG